MSTKPTSRHAAGRKNIVKKPNTAPASVIAKIDVVQNKAVPPHSASSGGADHNSRLKAKITNLFKKSICGDIFGSSTGGGNSMLGMMYQSRTKVGGILDYSDMDRVNEDDVEVDEGKDEAKLDMCDSSGSDDDSVDALNPRQQLAKTINNWSEHAANDLHIMREGGVHALIALAAFDDPGIKKCVATALYNLSTRSENCIELEKIGGASGVVTIAMNARSWKLARLCAMTLCNMSIAKGVEAGMAKAGAVIALVVLIGVRQHRLLPVCVQGLYNLTCVNQHFSGMERIMKALLTLPVVQEFDAFLPQAKALVNCSRYSWMRDRLIEDGVLAMYAGLVNSLPSREDPTEIVFYVVTTLRSLSENKTCLTDLISKGGVELLQCILPFCDPDAHLLLIKTVRNLLKIVHSFPAVIYAAAVHIVADIVIVSDYWVTLQYAASCIYTFTLDNLRSDEKLSLRTIRVLPKLLKSTDSLTQYFAVTACGNLFFSNICEDVKQLEILVLEFVEAGPAITDLLAIEELCVAFAKLSQERVYMSILIGHKRIETILTLLLGIINNYKTNHIIQESCCVAICRMVLHMEAAELVPIRSELSDLLTRLLGYPSYMTSNSCRLTTDIELSGYSVPVSPKNSFGNQGFGRVSPKGTNALNKVSYLKNLSFAAPRPTGSTARHSQKQLKLGYSRVLMAALGCIRAFAEYAEGGVCDEELLSKPNFLCKIALLAEENVRIPLIPKFCYSILSFYSYSKENHEALSNPRLLKSLFAMTKCDDVEVREMIATIFCNISYSVESRGKMVGEGVMDILTVLSGATNQLLQELCARCLCNLTVCKGLHESLISHGILHTLLMIALVRSVSKLTKQLASRAMLNLISNPENMEAVLQAGVIRALGTLASVHDSHTQSICAKGFLILTTTLKGRIELGQRKNVLLALFGLVRSGKPNKVMVLVGRAVCNLLQDTQTRFAAVNAGALSILKIIATSGFDELRESTARVIISLAGDVSLHPHLIKEPIVSVLVYILDDSDMWSLECCVKAFTCLAEHMVFRKTLIEKGSISALAGAILKGKVSSVLVSEEICRCLCFLSYESTLVETMITSGHILVVIYSLYKGQLCNAECANMMAIIIRNLSGGNLPLHTSGHGSATATVKSKTNLLKDEKTSHHVSDSLQTVPSKSAAAACTLIVEQEGFHLLGFLVQDFSDDVPQLYRSVVMILHNLSKVDSLHETLIKQGFMDIASKVAIYADSHTAPLEDPIIQSRLIVPDSVAALTKKTNSTPFHFGDSNSQTFLTPNDIYHLATAIRLLSMSPECRNFMVENNCILMLNKLLFDLTELSRYEIVSAINNLAMNRDIRDKLIEDHAIDLVVNLSHHAETIETQKQCSCALSNMSENANINSGSMSSLLVLSLRLDSSTQHDIHNAGSAVKFTNSISDGSNAGSEIIPPDGRYSPVGKKSQPCLKSGVLDGMERTAKNLNVDSSRLTVLSSPSKCALEDGIVSSSNFAHFKAQVNKPSSPMKQYAQRDMTESCMRLHHEKNEAKRVLVYEAEAEVLSTIPESVMQEELEFLMHHSSHSITSSSNNSVSMPGSDSVDEGPEDSNMYGMYLFEILPYTVCTQTGGLAKTRNNTMPLPGVVHDSEEGEEELEAAGVSAEISCVSNTSMSDIQPQPVVAVIKEPETVVEDRVKELIDVPIVMLCLDKDTTHVDHMRASSVIYMPPVEEEPADPVPAAASTSPTDTGTSAKETKKNKFEMGGSSKTRRRLQARLNQGNSFSQSPRRSIRDGSISPTPTSTSPSTNQKKNISNSSIIQNCMTEAVKNSGGIGSGNMSGGGSPKGSPVRSGSFNTIIKTKTSDAQLSTRTRTNTSEGIVELTDSDEPNIVVVEGIGKVNRHTLIRKGSTLGKGSALMKAKEI